MFNEFRGYSWIDWLYPVNYTVKGSNEDGLFPPFIQPGQRIGVFEEEYLRYLPMDPIADVNIKGIDAVRYIDPLVLVWLGLTFIHSSDRYSLVNSTLSRINPDLAMYLPGFANLTERYNGTPIFLCNPHYFGAPLEWLTKIQGMTQNLTTDLTRIDVEPNTGKSTNH